MAKQHHDDLLKQQDFATATRLFKIITGTNLVTNKHVLQYHAAQGMHYLIKKEYAKFIQRDLGNACQTIMEDKHSSQQDVDDNIPPLPFVQLMNSKFDDSSKDEEIVPTSHISKMVPPSHTIGVE